MKSLLPPGWPRPKGYANGISVSGRTIYTAGVVGWDAEERFSQDSLAGQFEQALDNIAAILACDGAGPHHLVRLTCYVTSIDEYLASLKAIGAAWKRVVGDHYPAMALVEVARLVEPQARVEIEATAVVPE
ncbi:RidA family protein [Sphingomonas rhizophila]|uniref:RidA family protein n=1 Tax=Sphingomonas rhizophila TaxID=2071607 RepID=A0A7G9SB97_9SPHN|nr:RidA family protein [Sphingomonas rhizophila]QNN65122.1 RidA family protein [Sphingomonas rhizophila]